MSFGGQDSCVRAFEGVKRLRSAAFVLVKGRPREAAPSYEDFKARWLRERQARDAEVLESRDA